MKLKKSNSNGKTEFYFVYKYAPTCPFNVLNSEVDKYQLATSIKKNNFKPCLSQTASLK